MTRLDRVDSLRPVCLPA